MCAIGDILKKEIDAVKIKVEDLFKYIKEKDFRDYLQKYRALKMHLVSYAQFLELELDPISTSFRADDFLVEAEVFIRYEMIPKANMGNKDELQRLSMMKNVFEKCVSTYCTIFYKKYDEYPANHNAYIGTLSDMVKIIDHFSEEEN